MWLPTPGPVISRIDVDFASANGGESRTVVGLNLKPRGAAGTVAVDGVSAPVTASSSTSLTFTVPASAVSSTNGNGSVSTVTVTTYEGAASTSGAPGNSLWYRPAYFGIAGAACYTAQAVTTSSGNVATVIDLSGNGYTLTPAATGPAYSSTGGGSPGTRPYWTCASATDNRLSNASFPAVPGNLGTWSIGANMTSSHGVNATLCDLGNALAFMVEIVNNENSLGQYPGFANGVTIGNGADFGVVSVFTNTTASLQVLNGGTAVTGSSSGAGGSTGGIVLGNRYSGGGANWYGRIYGAIFWSTALNSTQVANESAYWGNQGLGTPVVTGVTNVAPSNAGATFRISGTNFVPGMTVVGAGTGTVTVNYVGAVATTGATWANCTVTNGLSAGSYSLTLANPNGPSTTATLVATATADPMTIFGTACVGWWNGANVTLNGSKVAAMTDLSGMGQTLAVGASADQPAYTANDAHFNSRPSLTFNGSTTYLFISSLNLADSGASNDCVQLAVALQPASVAGNEAVSFYSNKINLNGVAGVLYTTGQKPAITAESGGYIWGSAVSTAANLVGIVPGTVNPTTSINVNNGTTVHGSVTNVALEPVGSFYVGSAFGSGDFFNGSGAAWVVLNSVAAATPTNLAAWNSLCVSTYGT